jgi:hypothetical protein
MGKRHARMKPRPAVPERTLPPEPPELPVGRAFVLQLTRETGPALEPFSGRVEHLRTGRRVRFESFADFQAAVIRLLRETSRQ